VIVRSWVGTSAPSTNSAVSGPYGLLTGASASKGARWSTTRCAGRLGDPEQQRDLPQRQVGAVVHRDQQHPIGQRQAPPAAGAGLLTAPACHDPHQLAEPPHRQTGEHRHPLDPISTDHLLHSKIIDRRRRPLRDRLLGHPRNRHNPRAQTRSSDFMFTEATLQPE
jgi:hypothetical protein